MAWFCLFLRCAGLSGGSAYARTSSAHVRRGSRLCQHDLPPPQPQALGLACRTPRPASLVEISLDYPGQAMSVQVQDGGVAVLRDRRRSVLTRAIRSTPASPAPGTPGLSPRCPLGLRYVPGRRQSAASQSASASITFWRTCGNGGISGLGGCKIGSRPGLVQAGNAGPRSL